MREPAFSIGIEEEYMIKKFSSSRSNNSFDVWMRNGNSRYGFNFIAAQNSQICFPAIKIEEWIVIATEIFRKFFTRYDFIIQPLDTFSAIVHATPNFFAQRLDRFDPNDSTVLDMVKEVMTGSDRALWGNT